MSRAPRRQYMMPIFFGPQPGPRADAQGSRFPVPDSRDYTMHGVVIRARGDELNAHLPEGFSNHGDPRLIVYFIRARNIDFLAGRHYNMLIVTVPVEYRGGGEPVSGCLSLVVWENLADPIITGREQLGFNKVYAELPDPSTYRGVTRCQALWDGHRFFRMQVKQGERADSEFIGEMQQWLAPGKGIFHVKYLPRTGEWGVPEVHQVVVTPPSDFSTRSTAVWRAEPAEAVFLPTVWQQMPTQHHIVEGLRRIQTDELLAAWTSETTGAGDFYNQYILSDFLGSDEDS